MLINNSCFLSFVLHVCFICSLFIVLCYDVSFLLLAILLLTRHVCEHELNLIIIKNIIIFTTQAAAGSGFSSISSVAFPHLRVSWIYDEETVVEF